VTLLSGGLDSTTTLAVARRDGFECFALTIDYGQRHRVELDAARAVAERLGARDHAIVPLDLRRFGGSALTADIAVPKGREPSDMTDIPVTYVPARNTIFLALALAWAETLGAEDIFIGVNALDSSGYPDCRP
jgi:7-cyano-7-deazaguanine synthase